MWSCNSIFLVSTILTSNSPAGFVLTAEPGVKFDVEILPLSCSQDFYDLSILTLMGINCNYTFFLSESLNQRLLFSNYTGLLGLFSLQIKSLKVFVETFSPSKITRH